MAKITIFGLSGTGKSTAGKMLAEQLGYAYMSTGNIFRAYAKSLGMTLAELEEASKISDIHDRKLDQDVKIFGENNDNFVFESRLAWYFIPDSFKIALVCGFDERVSRIARRENKTFEQAKEETIHREELVRERYAMYYGIEDFDNLKHFDFIVDTDANNANQVVENILKRLKELKLV